MPMRAKDIKGFLIDKSDQDNHMAMGLNIGIDSQGEKVLGLNREKLAEVSYNSCMPYKHLDGRKVTWEELKQSTKVFYIVEKEAHYRLADTIIAKEHELIEVQIEPEEQFYCPETVCDFKEGVCQICGRNGE